MTYCFFFIEFSPNFFFKYSRIKCFFDFTAKIFYI